MGGEDGAPSTLPWAVDDIDENGRSKEGHESKDSERRMGVGCGCGCGEPSMEGVQGEQVQQCEEPERALTGTRALGRGGCG